MMNKHNNFTCMLKVKYRVMLTVFMIGMLLVYGCGDGKDKTEDRTIVNKQNKEVAQKESLNLADTDTIKKRIYSKDLPKTRPDTTPYFADYRGYRYYFPCGPCRDKFIQDHEAYLDKWIKKGRRIRKRKL